MRKLILTGLQMTGHPAGTRFQPLFFQPLFRPLVISAMLVVTSLTLTGCSMGSLGSMSNLFGSKKNETVQPANVLYKEAETLLDKHSFKAAAKKYEEVDREHPYSPLARRAIVMSAFAHYKAGEFTQAISGARRYLTLHPGTKETALAQHIIVSSYFDQIADPRNDQTLTQKALKEAEILVRRYPDSRYAALARKRAILARDVLAASEMTVGRYYMKQGNYLAAINRFKTVVLKYQTTSQIQEALLRLTESYLALGIIPEAEASAAVLGHNYPDSKWYKAAYALLDKTGHKPASHSGSWISTAWHKTVAGVKSVSPF